MTLKAAEEALSLSRDSNPNSPDRNSNSNGDKPKAELAKTTRLKISPVTAGWQRKERAVRRSSGLGLGLGLGRINHNACE